MSRYLGATVYLLCGACTFKASCGSNKDIHADELEADIRARVTELGLAPTSVDCPEGIDAVVGAKFTCLVELAKTERHRVEIQVTSVDKEAKRAQFDTKWVEGNGIVATKVADLLAKDIAAKFGEGISFDCGDRLRFVDVNHQITCDVTDGTTRTKVTVTFDAKQSIKDVEFDKRLLSKKALEDMLTPELNKQSRAPVTVRCGDQPMLLRPPDGIVWCEVSDGTQRAKLRLEIDEQRRVQKWAVITPPT